ncbi:STAS domain-containing protein [Oscillochloris sp. ZM17-4]|uniref:STAS domain-containing protein n=1 Tax=Oscillochloris sp. ZM17-4 TaxID=2866714 RepID=UPI001C7305FE|nr:STAS domain-containing protein [Oscillochloris sp. ZM17-4]MBX0330572.1 STAS domain-containing protein [Oscillochloris sp. ZM17-4]
MLHARRLSRIFVMIHADEDLRRRGQNLLTILWGLIGITLLTLPITVLNGRNGPLINSIIALPLGAWLIVLTHRGHVSLVATLVIISTTASLVLVPIFGSADFSASAYYFLLNILIAGVILSPIATWGMVAMNLAALIMAALLSRQEAQVAPSILVTSVNAGILQAFAAMIVVINMVTTARALRDARQARAETQLANQSLAMSNASLERQVAERTAALSVSLAESEAHALALQESLDARERMSDLITDLSLPMIPISHDALVVPLVGALDSARASLLLQRVLAQIESQRARTLILDVTGLPIIDTHVARVLLSTAQAARLLGARSILVGIRPEVAQALVSLGVDLSKLQTHATLQQAIGTLFVLR